MRCKIWYRLRNLKNVKNTHGGVLLVVELQVKKVTLLHMYFFRFFKLYKWYQIAQNITYNLSKRSFNAENLEIKWTNKCDD